jgi:hypothetical protein
MLSGKEIWQNNIRFATTSGALVDFVDEQETLEQLETAFRAMGMTQLGYSNATLCTWMKFNEINGEGRYAGAGTTRIDMLPPMAGQSPPSTFAPQLALAVSWATDTLRGLASKGRIFIPMPFVSVDATGQIPPANRQNIATKWAQLLADVNNAPGLDTNTLTASVVSGGRQAPRSPVAAGVARQIVRVRVGSVLDTMRSRRNALDESYTEAPVPGQ